MKKFLKTLMLAVFVVPVILVMTACESGPVTPPNYEIQEGDYEFDEYFGYKIQTEADGYNAYFSRTNDNLDTIIYDYLTDLETEYYNVLSYDGYDDEVFGIDYDAEDWIYDVFDLFTFEQIFTLSVPDTTDMYSGIMTVDDERAPDLFDLDVTVNPNRSGEMSVRDTEGYGYDDYVISYEYVNGTITVTIDVAEIIMDLADKYHAPRSYNNYIPVLWVQFDLQ